MAWHPLKPKKNEGARLRRELAVATGIPEDKLFPQFAYREEWYRNRMFLKPGKTGIMLIEAPTDSKSYYDGLFLTPVALCCTIPLSKLDAVDRLLTRELNIASTGTDKDGRPIIRVTIKGEVIL